MYSNVDTADYMRLVQLLPLGVGQATFATVAGQNGIMTKV